MVGTFELQNPWRKPGYTFPEGCCIARGIFDRLFTGLEKKEVTIVIGSRQVGKTFLMNRLIRKLIDGGCAPSRIFYFNFDAFNLVELIQNDRDFFDFIRHYGHPGQRSFVFLDEAQRVPEIGLLLKRYYDLDPNIKFIVSGSSSLQIKSQVKETLTGRKHLYELLPISYSEYLRYKGHEPGGTAMVEKFESDRYQMLLREYVLFGGYPGVVVSETPEDKIQLLKEIYRSYIQKDISDFLKIEDIPAFNRLVRFAASQATGLCKVNEIGKNVRLTRYFVEKYLFALEETFIIAFLRPCFVNLGKALVKTPKLYFHDTGIRNAVVGHFESLQHRTDAGCSEPRGKHVNTRHRISQTETDRPRGGQVRARGEGGGICRPFGGVSPGTDHQNPCGGPG